MDKLPKKLVPYAQLIRIDKPIGTWLLFLPSSYSILMAGYYQNMDPITTISTLGLFGVGSLLLRGAGCTINDMWDRDLDKLVDRTKSRPLAAGTLTQFQALQFLGIQLSLGLAILLQLNVYSIVLGASSLALVISYPLMKRVTFWPQAFLGLTFNWGCLLGSSAMLGYLHLPVALPLYLSGICWTLVYDTIYALQDKNDDVSVGIKSTALRFGDNLKRWISGFAILSVGSLALAGYNNGQDILFYLISVGGSATHLFWQIYTLNPLSASDAWKKFKSNRNLGIIVSAGIVLDWIFKYI
jgi:4-hydroxybenzoate polyprenyltransferase